MAAPIHKQDKQAVREKLQSFRQVAHLSARSALAKHSLQQLRNATIAKGVLLGMTGLAAVWFFAEPVWGRPLQIWKGAVCSLGAILSALEFSRSLKLLRKPLSPPITPGTESDETAEVPSPDTNPGETPAVPVATEAATEEMPVPAESVEGE
jgi:hypothetical protein